MQDSFDFYSPTNLKSYNLDESVRYQLNILSTLDVFTRKHSENVGNLALRICETLHLRKNFTIYCAICGYLHDIGKAFIPPEILQKEAKLTDEEFEIMKTHTTIGYDIGMKDLKLRPYANGPLYHHEGLDGSGYPNGVTYEHIPYESQIIRIADEYDAIVSKRQYKSHVNISDTLELIVSKTKPSVNDSKAKVSNVGKVDPKIVKALLKVVKADINYEIACVYEYIEYLKEQIKRLENIKRWHNEMQTFTSEKDIAYYTKIIKKTFSQGENFENYLEILAEYRRALDIRTARINLLYDEIKKIKKLEC